MSSSGIDNARAVAEPHPLLAAAPWLGAPATRRLLAALEAGGKRARVVGGAVRNTLLGLATSDIDVATDALPEEVMRTARAARLKVIPTGIAHGTVTIVVAGKPFEVTTLRRDVETHGRHATVAFTDDWRADAERRDFTMNALYCDARGVLFDPVGGLADLERHRVRFIGDAHQRIREDYLRILRFFRFSAQYGDGQIDASGLEACIAERAGLARLSAERVRAELLKLLDAPHVLYVLDVMHAAGLLADVLGCSPDMRTLRRLHATARPLRMVAGEHTRTHAEAFDGSAAEVPPLLSLAALAVQSAADTEMLMRHLRLSRAERDRLLALASIAGDTGALPHDPKAGPALARQLAYRYGAAAADGLRLAWARSPLAVNDPAMALAVLATARTTAPRLPFTGADIVALGVAPGRRVGEILGAFESWWIAAGFPDDAERNAAELARLAMVTKS
jgi:poly(A) polymerase